MPRVTKVLNPSKRSSPPDAPKPWNIMEVEVEKDDGSIVKADTFDTVADGDVVELEPNNYTNPNTGKTYNGWNAKVPRAPRPGQKNTADMTPVMEAIRMVFREIKEVKDQNNKILAGVEALIGPAEIEGDPVPTQERNMPPDMPADFGLKPEDPRNPEPTTVRDWQSVGQSGNESTPPEPTVEPMPDEPEDLASFMNG